MSHSIEEILGHLPGFGNLTTNDLLLHLIKEQHAMSLNLAALTAAVAKLSVDVTALINADQTAINASAAGAAAQLVADQAAVDAVVPTLSAISAVAEAALTAPVAAPAAPPAA